MIIFLDTTPVAPSKRIAATSTPNTLGTRGTPPPWSTPAAGTEGEVIVEEYFGRRDLTPQRRPGERHGRGGSAWEIAIVVILV
jgi:hypothetical protein